MNTSLKVLVLAVASLAVVGCKTRKVEETGKAEMADTPVAATTDSTEVDPRSIFIGAEALEKNPCLKPRVVYFDLDRTEIKGEFSEMIGCHAKFVKMNPSYNLTLEGNADERGTREYNLGLGERRGNAVSDMLKAQEAPAAQVNVVSYGEEKPTCSTSDDGCWSQNRRVEFVYSTK